MTHSQRFRRVLQLLRPLNFILFFAGVGLGGMLADGSGVFEVDSVGTLVLAMVSAALIGGGANAINDVYDLQIDRINRPNRPLPSGDVSIGAARMLWIVLTFLGVILGWLISPLHGLIAAFAATLLWAYNVRLKQTPLAGNLTVAAILGLTVVYGGLVSTPAVPAPVAVGALFAFLTTLAREGAKDIEDIAGDSMLGARTLPVVWGKRRAAWLMISIIFLTLIAFPIPLIWGFSVAFLGLGLPSAYYLLVSAWSLLGVASEDEGGWRQGAASASSGLKVAMIAGMIALALTRVG